MSGTGLAELLAEMPDHLEERIRCFNIRQSFDNGEYILYWLRNAVRTDENPALDVARILSIRSGLPLLVYHGLSEHYEYASDRHHTFILQGASDIQRQFDALGISYAFHLATQADRRPHLISLSRAAALVVTEDMPVDAPLKFLNTLLVRVAVPVLCVDTACVVPMCLTGKPFYRAFQYRQATATLYSERLKRDWPTNEGRPNAFDLDKLPFVPVDLQAHEIASLVAECEIDHVVGPVDGTTGGSTSGYHRWERFKSNGLSGYARHRNNALVDGVSRMSPFLHYGMVSPMRIAREAAAVGNAGATKFLDELLIWRELAYSFCFHRTDYDQWTAIPDWAQSTLQQHADDPRRQVYAWEQLARGATADPLWNAAQKSLLIHGELHNNLRMTWGKTILSWTKTPQRALQTMIDLNHRYALDGRDPASYGGILWCLGQFDRPFQPEQPIFGSVRSRTTSQHAQRLDAGHFLSRIRSRMVEPITRVAVVGAGISGLIAARALADHGLSVTILEKSRGVGGRMATRRFENESGADHGAQYFTVRDPRFDRYVKSWIELGIVAEWPIQNSGPEQRFVMINNAQVESEPNPVDRFVGVPAMNSICKHLATGLEIVKNTRVEQISRSGNCLRLSDSRGESLGCFDRVIVSAPAEQTAELLAEFPAMINRIADIKMYPCWATMATLPEPVTDRWVGAFLQDSFLKWAARNSSKPGRNADREILVMHATPEWTLANWETNPSQIADRMISEFNRVTGLKPQTPIDLQAHRWKYALPVDRSKSSSCFYDPSNGIAACGDWAVGSRVEGAFLSGMAAAGRILGSIASAPDDISLRPR